MKSLFFIILCVIIAFFQLSVLGVYFAPAGIPNLVLATAVSLVIIKGFEFSLKWIILAGLLADAGTNWFFGTGTLILLIISLAIGFFIAVANIRSRRLLFWPSFSVLLALLVWIFDLLAGLFLKIENYWIGKGWTAGGVNSIGWEYALKMLFTVLAGYAIYYLAGRLDKTYSKPARIISRI